jgi:hypothetical protein
MEKRRDALSEMRRPELNDLLGATLRVPDHVVHRWFGDETLMLNLNTGQYHCLNRPEDGFSRCWLRRKEGSTRRYGGSHPTRVVAADQIGHAVAVFCRDLVDRGLIEVRDRR